MSTLKIGTHSDMPYNLEKGCSESRTLHSESCQACSVQPARTCARRSFVKHPWIVFGTVVLTWLVFSYGKRALSRPRDVWHQAGDKVEYAPPKQDVSQCVSGTNWTSYYEQPPWASEYPYGAETTFSLPIDSTAFYLLSQGAFQQGLVNIEQSSEVADTVDVRVRVAYRNDKALERASVCSLARADSEYGVGIFTPSIRHHSPHLASNNPLNFDITLTLPAGNEAPLLVKKLGTEMPNYSQHIADLQTSVLFDKISLKSANGELSVQSVAFRTGKFSSLNGEINGHFIAQSSLDLHTANGRIIPTVNLLHRESEDSPKFTVHTTNGQIDAKVSLTSDASLGGEFEVYAKSINGKIGLKFFDTPVDSVLWCSAETTVGEVKVELDSAFEGTYSLQSLLGKKFVSERDVEDPAGKGRQRVISRNESAGRVEGELKWIEKDEGSFENDGQVVLKTLVSSVTLVV